MEKREEALLEALAENAEETARWKNYLHDNEQAIENLEMFSKSLAVDVMVPIGSKAFTPGQLIHTNEVMVGHYQNYFSKCSAHTAKEICKHRIGMANNHLEALKTETEMWQNKLDKPYMEGVIPTEEQREIIEDYDEEQEMLWRAKHKTLSKTSKLRENEEWRREILAKEAEEQQNDMKEAVAVTEEEEKTDADILQMLEQAELMEELKQELDNLEVEGSSDEILVKLLSGEMKIPQPKHRVAHVPSGVGDEILMKGNKTSPHESHTLQGVMKKAEVPTHTLATNNNFCVNPELLKRAQVDVEDGNESDDSTSSVTPVEVQVIEEQAKFLSNLDQIGFYEYQLQIVEQKLHNCNITGDESIEQKLHLFKVRGHLEELLESAAEAVGAEELAAQEAKGDSEAEKETQDKQKRRISFAAEDHTLEFHKNETVAEMLPKVDNAEQKRDIITLDDYATNSNIQAEPKAELDKKQIILNRVQENLQFVAEHQSKQDFDLVNKIINTAESVERTLHISFKHSAQTGVTEDPMQDANKEDEAFPMPATPAELYRLVVPLQKQQPSTLFIDSYEGEENVITPILKEKDRKEAYRDLRMEFSNPTNLDNTKVPVSASVSKPDDATTNPKSILRNKNVVDSETYMLDNNIHYQSNKENVNKRQKKKIAAQPINEDEYMSAYLKVMHDVVEKPLPEPLPSGKYIDTHTPKKRISRFKQMRTVADTA